MKHKNLTEGQARMMAEAESLRIRAEIMEAGVGCLLAPHPGVMPYHSKAEITQAHEVMKVALQLRSESDGLVHRVEMANKIKKDLKKGRNK